MPSMLCCSPVPVPSPAIGGVGLVTTPPPAPPLSLRRKVHVQDHDLILPAVAVMAVNNPACDAGEVMIEEAMPVTSAAAPTKKKKNAARWRPPRLIVPVVCDAGEEAMAVAAMAEKGKEEEVVEVEGEGFWLASRRGMRHAMEDGYGVITHKIDGHSKMSFYGVYDGHGGRAAVDFVADRLGSNVVAAAEKAKRSSSEEASPSSSSSPAAATADHVVDAIRAAYLATDSEFLSKGARGGACAATALVMDGDLYVANVGDCRAVLSRHGAATAVTSDHTPARDDERSRIHTSGGYVSCGSNGVWRVQDSLAVTRAFGDGGLKRWVVAEPEVTTTRLAGAGEFLVLASDGLWNKVSNQEAVDAVAAAAAGGEHSVEPCRRLVEMARRRGSRDDVTVMVVDLRRFLTC